MEELAEALFWLCVALNPRCTYSIGYSVQCPITDTRVIQFSDKYMDWARGCIGHAPILEAWRDGPLKKIRTGR